MNLFPLVSSRLGRTKPQMKLSGFSLVSSVPQAMLPAPLLQVEEIVRACFPAPPHFLIPFPTSPKPARAAAKPPLKYELVFTTRSNYSPE